MEEKMKLMDHFLKIEDNRLNEEKNTKNSYHIENLPKIVLGYLLSFLDAKDLANIWVLNKYFWSILTNESICSKIIWKSICERTFPTIDEDVVKKMVEMIKKTENEKRMNEYCLFFKYNFQPKWDRVNHGKRITVNNDGTSLYIGNEIKK